MSVTNVKSRIKPPNEIQINICMYSKKNHYPVWKNPDKAVIAIFRNEYTKSIILMIFCFSRIHRIVFAFHPILFGKHLQI